MELNVIHQNKHIDIVHDACKLCYKGKPALTLEAKLKYIQDKVNHQHESVLEHSNVIMLFSDISGVSELMQLAEFMAAGPELNFKTASDLDGEFLLLVGGNIRAYKNVIRNIENSNNKFAHILLREGFPRIPKAYFSDFISDGIMELHEFKDDECIYDEMKYYDSITKDHYEFVNIDPIESILDELNTFVAGDVFEISDLIPMCTATIFFSRISRIISQQVTRHRNAISQQSQRYVDETGCVTVNPMEFKDVLPLDFEVTTSMGNFTLETLGDFMNNIYKELRAAGMTKEDARYYLTQNVETSLYMTATFKKLFHFLEVRTGSHAQAEIRVTAENMYNDFMEAKGEVFGHYIFKYLLPKYKLTEIDNIEDMNNCEEVID